MSEWVMDSEACIYVMGAPGSPLKIGFSHNPVGRCATLSMDHKLKLEILHMRGITSAETYGAERLIHTRLSAKRVKGEWFAVTLDQAIAAVERGVDDYLAGARAPKKDPDPRTALCVPVSWVTKVDDWRRRQLKLPNRSEAIRQLVELGLAANPKP